MKACWNCGRQLEDPEASCAMCGATVPVVTTEPDERPRRRSRADAPQRESYSLTQEPALASRAARALVAAAEAVAPVVRVLIRLVYATQKHPEAAAVLAGALLFVMYMSAGGGAATATEYVQCWSMNDAQKAGLLLRQALPDLQVVDWGGRKIKILDAWVGEIGEYRSSWLFGGNRYVHQSGKYRLYFVTPRDTWPESPQFYVGLPPRLVEAIPSDATGKPTVLHVIDVELRAATPLTVMVKDSAKPDAGMPLLTFH